MRDKGADLPEVSSFLEDVKGFNGNSHEDELVGKIIAFKKEIEKVRDQKNVYKTPAEKKEADEQIYRGITLIDDITKVLNQVKNKEGKFASQKGLF